VWFESLTGFRESDVDDVAAQFVVEGTQITSRANNRVMRCGRFEVASLGDLRRRRNDVPGRAGSLRIREVVADAQRLHADRSNAGAFFQVASQFNTLEMVSPRVTPEDGIDRYERDHTQGPACAIACGAGTIFRNYLVPLDGRAGQTSDRQINCLADLAAALGVDIEMHNGYALATAEQLDAINQVLGDADEPARDAFMAHLRIGLQWHTEVTIGDTDHTVTQAYCSALPLAYVSHPEAAWAPLARLVLDAAYEASLAAALINANDTGNERVYLTLLGGGAFGNPASWILDAIERARCVFAHAPLEVTLVSYGSPNPELRRLLAPPPSWADVLFAEPPRQWGLRGDPHLWTELHARLRVEEPPATRDALGRRIHQHLLRLCGVDVATADEPVHIQRYPQAGMSGGHVHPPTWRDRLVPLLTSRFGP
jgi:hypothetical protein